MVSQIDLGLNYGIPYLLPQLPQVNIDPEFWERLREALRSHMKAAGLNQRALAEKLALDPTTLNNFLNHQSKTMNGLAVALACRLIDLVCDGTTIGRIVPNGHTDLGVDPIAEQLVLEFDDAFELKRESERPTIVLMRKPTSRHETLRLSITKIG
jgi:transcriptional regulator with XRE-family HTH domain